MPKKLEEELFREVNKKHPNWSQDRKNAYVYSIMNSIKKKKEE